mgnify:CR=1 FL=1
MNINNTIRQVMTEQNLDYDSDLEQLDEIRILRGASALVFAQKSKQSGDKATQHSNEGKSILNRFKQDMTTDDRVELLQSALVKMFDTQIELRKQIGNLVGVALTSALISERSNKELTKIMKQSSRRR